MSKETNGPSRKRQPKLTARRRLCSQWHPTKNGDLKPSQFTAGSNKKVWWKCDKGHSWQAAIDNRTLKSSGCPECAGRRVGKDNNLKAKFPSIAKEWHPTKNKPLKPTEVTSGSNQKVWWKCNVGADHEWSVSIADRTNYKTGCPFCDGKKVSVTNSLAALNLDVAAEWHPTKNKPLKPTEVTSGSNQKVWWKCDKGHSYQAAIKSRTGRSSGCPECAGKRVGKDNNLKAKFPSIAKEWHPTKNKSLKPADVTSGSGKKVWWKCDKGHSWQAAIHTRTLQSSGCPECGGKRVGKDNNLKAKFPSIAKEWHPTKNKPLKPTEVTSGSNQKVWWKCDKGHSWQATISDRTLKSSGCPKCKPKISKPQIHIFSELKTIFSKIKLAEKVSGRECDVFLMKYKIAIEYDGAWYHGSRKRQDKKKNRTLSEAGITLIRIREAPLPKLGEHDLVVDVSCPPLVMMKSLLENLVSIRNFSKAETSKIDRYLKRTTLAGQIEYKKLVSILPRPLPGTSLEDLHPDLTREWDKGRNTPLTPNLFTVGSKESIWWVCEHGHSWKATIANRVKGSGCRKCYEKTIGNNLRRISVQKTGSLRKKYPQIAKQWHPTLNESLTSLEVSPGSEIKVWWKCDKGHSYQAAIKSRTGRSSGCPECGGKRVGKDNNLKAKFPSIAKEWHPTKNKSLKPTEVTSGSGKKVWWRCKKKHVWESVIQHRTGPRKQGCPKCQTFRRI